MDFINIGEFLLSHLGLLCVVAIVALFGWQYLKAFLTNGFNWLSALGSATVNTTKTTVTGTEDVIAALHTLSVWCLTNGEPELMAKVTSLWADLKKAVPPSTPPATGA